MNFHKNKILIVGGGVGLLLLAVAIFFLISCYGDYADSVSSLSSARNRLKALNERNPFPSLENEKLASENLAVLTEKYTGLQVGLMSAQLNPVQIEPARFAPLMEDSIKRLKAKATQLKSESGREIKLPSDNDVGFKDYAAGKLPPNDTNVMRRLVLQVQGLEVLLGLAIDARLDAVNALQRDEFEIRAEAAPAPEEVSFRSRGRGRMEPEPVQAVASEVGGFPLPEPHPLYDIERFVIEVTGPESAVWDFMNRVVASPLLFTISDVYLKNNRANPGKPFDFKEALRIKTEEKRQVAGQESALAEAKLDDLTIDERIVGGREPVTARIVADMVLLKKSEEGLAP